jgi:hypothetical protein
MLRVLPRPFWSFNKKPGSHRVQVKESEEEHEATDTRTPQLIPAHLDNKTANERPETGAVKASV